MKLTPARRAALMEVHLAGEGGLQFYTFSQAMRRKLVALELIEQVPNPGSLWARYGLTDAGREALGNG